MLVFTRREGEQIQIGDDITITIVRIGPFSVRLGIEAAPDVPIMRRELLERGPPTTQETGAKAKSKRNRKRPRADPRDSPPGTP